MATAQELAVKEYKTADKKEKALLEKLFGKQVFIPNIMEQVKTLEDACKIKGIDPALFKQIPVALAKLKGLNLTKGQMLAIQTRAELELIADVLNGGWIANWKDGNQKKWYPWFTYSSTGSGFGFSYTDYVGAFTFADLGSRLYYATEELAAYAGKQFIEKYRIIHESK